jgi:hypothetical protein
MASGCVGHKDNRERERERERERFDLRTARDLIIELDHHTWDIGG